MSAVTAAVRVAPELPRIRWVSAPDPARLPAADGVRHTRAPLLSTAVLRAQDLSLRAVDDEPRPAPAGEPDELVRSLAAAIVEVVRGARPAAQLARWLAPGVLVELRRRGALAALLLEGAAAEPLCRAPRVRRVLVQRLDEHVVEAVAVVDDHHRVRAMALRLENHRSSWRVAALEIG